MGPRSEGARKGSHEPRDHSLVQDASMGPRSEGARKAVHAGAGGVRRRQASMGPRSEGARKAAAHGEFPRHDVQLQWGRARRERGKPSYVVVEHGGTKCFNGAALGGSAESRACYELRRWCSGASMGPRSEGARKGGVPICARFRKSELQWGRARRERGKQAGRPSASGVSRTLQWGRARRERGKYSCTSRIPTSPRRFNGAALGGSAESGPGVGRVHRRPGASMGPRSEGARKEVQGMDEAAYFD